MKPIRVLEFLFTLLAFAVASALAGGTALAQQTAPTATVQYAVVNVRGGPGPITRS
jgi:uncharacterized protein YraI